MSSDVSCFESFRKLGAVTNNLVAIILLDRRELQMKNVRVYFVALGAVAAGILVLPRPACAQTAAATYKAKCAGCHGADGKANTGAGKALGAHDFGSEEVTKMSDADLVTIVTDGKGKMPAYGKNLKEPEIKDLVAYVRELAKQK
jgi:cytochrome c6